MMKQVIREAKSRNLLILGHEALYDWWTARSAVRLEMKPAAIGVKLPPSHQVALEFLSARAVPARVLVNDRPGRYLLSPQRKQALLVLPVTEGEIKITFEESK